jgi:hypothetical protein
MNLETKRAILATLLRSNRPDLANAVARVVTANELRHGGDDVWGKNARLHVYMSNLKLEEYPPGGKIRGQKVRVVEFSWGHVNDENILLINKMLDQLVKDIQVAPFENLSALVKMWAEKITGHPEIQVFEQRAIDAPNPVENAKAPPPQQNSRGVHIEFRPTARQVALRDTTDQNNLPAAFTKGPKAYQVALKTFGEWQDLGFTEILRLWRSLGIPFHDYLAMD